jgi:putative ABC transport system permease protein
VTGARAIRLLELAIGFLLILGLAAARLLPPAVLVLSLPFLYLLAFKPVLRRLALGHIARRPRETALVLLGSLLGTAIITGSFVVGDTLDASIQRTIYTQLGPIDELVSAPSGGLPAVEAAIAGLPPSEVDGHLRITNLGVTAATAGRSPKADPRAQLLEVDFDQAKNFGGDEKATGISGPTPKGGEAVIGRDLADTLGVERGGTVRVFAYGLDKSLTVTRVLPRLGVAGFQAGERGGSKSSTIFVMPGTAAELFARRAAPGQPPSDLVAVSNVGNVRAGVDKSDAVKASIERALAGNPASIVAVKQQVLANAKAFGDQFTQLFSMIGLFSVVAGILLLINIFVMLSQERQSELGMLRAVGLKRSGLVGAFSLEGWLYALGSAALGTIAGLGVGRAIVIVAATAFSGGGPAGQGGLELTYTATRASINLGFLIGFTISLVTILGTSARIARLNVIRAIRDLPEPKIKQQHRDSLVLAVLAAIVGLELMVEGTIRELPVIVLLAPSILAVGLIRIFAFVRHLRFRQYLDSRQIVVSSAATFVILWQVFAFALFPRAFRNTEIVVFVIQGISLVLWAVVLLSQNQEIIGTVVRLAAGGSKAMSMRLGLAYPLARRVRTALTLATYALVVYMLTTITIFSHLFGTQIAAFTGQVSGGYDLVAVSNPTNPIPLDQLRAQPGVARAAAITELGGSWSGGKIGTDTLPWPAGAFDASYIEHEAPKLARRPPQYATDLAAYQAVLADPSLFIPTAYFLQRGGGGPPTPVNVGEQYTVTDPVSGRSKTLTVAAVGQSGFGNLRPLMSYDALREVFGDRVVANVFYVSASDPAQANRVATRINGAFLANGADASAFSEVIAANISQQQQFFRLMRGYLALGLLVGIAGLGVVMVTAVRERRREVGVLRSLGFESKSVRRAFLAESAFVACEGIGLGVGLAIVTVWRLTGNADFGATLRFSVPVGSLVFVALGTLVASLIATATPAQQAARIRPAVALRIAD